MRSLACLVFLSTLLTQAFAAEPEPVLTVRYSYTKWSRAGQPRFVLVPEATNLKPGLMADRVRELFRQLVSEKRNSYGDTRLAFQPDAEQTGVVYVYLDETKAAYHPIVVAETVYTFTENGATKVVFPKVAPDGLTRAQVTFPAYVLELPLWELLPPAQVRGALAVLPDGQRLPVELALSRLSQGDKALTDALWGLVPSGGAPALAVVKAAPALGLKELPERLIPLLSSANVELRLAAIDGLAGQDTPAVNQALRKVMDQDPEPRVKDQAALRLSQAKDPAFSTAATYHALKSSDPAAVAAAAARLGDSQQAEAGQKLLEVLNHADAGVRAAAIAALLKRGDRQALEAKLADDKVALALRLDIAAALSTDKEPATQLAGLAFVAKNGQGAASVAAAKALSGHDKPAAYAALSQVVVHPEADTRRAAAAALSVLGTPAALEVLAQAKADDPETGADMEAAAREIYARQSLEFGVKGSRQKSPLLQRAAVASLGRLVAKEKGKSAKKDVLEALSALSRAEAPGIRAAAALSYEAIGEASVKDEVLRLANDQAVEVQRAAAHALRAFPSAEANTLLLGFAKTADVELLANALGSLGALKVKEALNPIISQLNHEDVKVRRAATQALVDIGKTLEQRNPLLSFFSERLFDRDAEVRLAALEGLSLVKDDRTVTAMAALLQDPVVEIRIATLSTMAKTGDPAAVEAIAGGLEDDELAVRRAALEAFAALNAKDAIRTLEAYGKKETDAALVKRADEVAKDLAKKGK